MHLTIQLEELSGEHKIAVANIAKDATATAQLINNVKAKYTKNEAKMTLKKKTFNLKKMTESC